MKAQIVEAQNFASQQEESIDDIVNELAKVLDDPERIFDKQNIARYEDELFTGWELLLCNIKEVKGVKVNRHGMYNIPCPVLHKRNHRSIMRTLFFSGGRPSVMKYLSKWVKPTELEVCRAIVMGKYSEYLNQKLSA